MSRIIPPALQKASIICSALFSIILVYTPSILLADEVIQIPHESSSTHTIAHDFLEMEESLGTIGPQITYLNNLMEKAAHVIPVRKEYSTEGAIATLRAIDTLLKKEGFYFKNNVLLSIGIKTKGIDCDNYSALYTAIAEALHIPMIPVCAPNHSFIRFCFTDGTYLNWELLEGKHLPDSFYITIKKISPVSIQKGVYLKNLSRKEFIALQYNNIGVFFFQQKKYKNAIPLFSKAIELYPQFSSAYHNRGTSLYALKQPTIAKRDLEQAALLDPNRATTNNTLGDIYLDLKQTEKALGYYQKSIECDPTFYAPYQNIALLLQLLGKKQESAQWLKKADEIRKADAPKSQ